MTKKAKTSKKNRQLRHWLSLSLPVSWEGLETPSHVNTDEARSPNLIDELCKFIWSPDGGHLHCFSVHWESLPLEEAHVIQPDFPSSPWSMDPLHSVVSLAFYSGTALGSVSAVRNKPSSPQHWEWFHLPHPPTRIGSFHFSLTSLFLHIFSLWWWKFESHHFPSKKPQKSSVGLFPPHCLTGG